MVYVWHSFITHSRYYLGSGHAVLQFAVDQRRAALTLCMNFASGRGMNVPRAGLETALLPVPGVHGGVSCHFSSPCSGCSLLHRPSGALCPCLSISQNSCTLALMCVSHGGSLSISPPLFVCVYDSSRREGFGYAGRSNAPNSAFRHRMTFSCALERSSSGPTTSTVLRAPNWAACCASRV